jgi:ABC-type multidrug transport system fused ATPase/permease subunit
MTATRLLSLLSNRERARALGLLLLMVGGAALEVLGIGLIVPLASMLVGPEATLAHPALSRVHQWLESPPPERFALWLLCGFLAVVVFKNLYLGALAFLKFRFVFAKESDVARRLVDGFLRGPYELHLHRHSAQITRNLITEVNNLFAGVVIPLLEVGAEVLVIVLLAAVLAAVMPGTTLLVLVVGGIIVALLHSGFRSILSRYGAARVSRSGARIQAIGDALGGLKEIKVLGREDYFASLFFRLNEGYLQASRVFVTLNALPRLLIETLTTALIVIAALLLTAGSADARAAAPGIVLLCLVALRLMPAATRILTALSAIRFYLPSLEAVCRDLDEIGATSLPAAPSAHRGGGKMRVASEIAVEQVTFTYPGAASPVLDGLSLVIPAGSMCALVGPSGAGKSTLVDLILGIFRPSAGRILVDGIDIAGNRSAWMNSVGYVPQTVHLLDDCIRRNIAFGVADDEVDDEKVWHALRAAQLDGMINAMPRKLDDTIGERGIRLSGGQRQRIGIARALYSEPQILILDEATSALDPQTERAVAETLLEMRPARTIVVIAHRLDTVKRCDRLFCLSEGRVQAAGSYQHLLDSSAFFAQFVGKATL